MKLVTAFMILLCRSLLEVIVSLHRGFNYNNTKMRKSQENNGMIDLDSSPRVHTHDKMMLKMIKLRVIMTLEMR